MGVGSGLRMGERDRPRVWMGSGSWGVGGVGRACEVVGRWSPWSLSAERGPVGRVGGVPQKGVASLCWTCLGASGPALGRVALVSGACAWFGANLADTDPEGAELFNVFAVDA